MRILTLFCLLAFGVAQAQDTEPKEIKTRQLKVKAFKIEGKQPSAPKETKITSAAELAKAIPHKATQDEISKQVDFSKEYVLYFAWAGSGADKLTFKVEEKEVVFSLKRGLTRSYVTHGILIAVPLKYKFKMGPAS
jgi:hypothetical protein